MFLHKVHEKVNFKFNLDIKINQMNSIKCNDARNDAHVCSMTRLIIWDVIGVQGSTPVARCGVHPHSWQNRSLTADDDMIMDPCLKRIEPLLCNQRRAAASPC
jgi:hypothetical protein